MSLKTNCYYNLFWLMLWLMGSGCQDKVVQAPNMHIRYPAAMLREDFAQLLAIIEQNHPALYDFTSQQEFRRLVQQQSAKLDQPLAVTDFYRVLLPLITSIGCGHSSLELFDRIENDSIARVLPLQLVFDERKGYLLKDHRLTGQLPSGTQILSINGKTIPALLQKLQAYISTEGNNASYKKASLNLPRFNALLAIEENFPQAYRLHLRLPTKDSTQHVLIPAVHAHTYIKAYRASLPKDSLLQLGIDTAKRVAILTIKSFNFYNQLDAFKRFVDESFAKIRKANIQHLLLDVRQNGGGDPFCSAYLLTYLASKPIPYFAHPYDNYEPLARPLSLATDAFTGQLFVLTDGLCSSTTGHLCALLKAHQRGQFIGTETNGTYTCNDNSKTFYLANTGLLVRMARGTFQVAASNLPRFRGIIPDYRVEPTPVDWLQGNDPVMQFALQRVEQVLSPQLSP